MYFIKCTGCGKLNEIKTEYQTFCNHCNNKLANNFTVWKRRNPKGTLVQFQESECITYEQKIKHESMLLQTTRKKKNPALLVVGIVVLFFLGVSVAGYFVKPYVINFVSTFIEDNQDAILAKVNDKNWDTYQCGTLGLSLQSPSLIAENKQAINEIPAEYRQVIQQMNVYNMENPIFKMIINASSIVYAPGIETSLVGAKDGVLNQLKQNPINQQFQSTDRPYELNAISGILSQGTFVSGGAPMGFQLLSLLEESKLWQILVVFDQSGENGNKAAEKVIASIKINKS